MMILFRLIRWIIKRLGWYTCLAWLLLAVAQASLAQTLADAIRELSVGLLLPAAMIGLLAGWSLGAAKRLPAWLGLTILTLLGIELALVQVGRLGRLLVAIGQDGLYLGRQIWQQPLAMPPDLTPLVDSVIELWQTVSVLVIRLGDWSAAVIGGNPVYDPAATALLWSFALWSLAAWAAWALRRMERPLLAITPAGAFLAITLAYYPKDISGLYVMVGAALLLVGFTQFRVREQSWQAGGIDYADEIRPEAAIAIVIITVSLVAVASLTPSLSIWQVARWFTTSTRLSQPLAESLGVRQVLKPAVNALAPFRSPGLPRGHLLGSGPELSEQVALTIRVDESTTLETVPRYKWRSLTYDRYTGRGWRAGTTQAFTYEAGQPAIDPIPPNRRRLQQTVQTIRPQGDQVYMAGDVLTVNQPYQIEWRGPGDAFGIVTEADSYQVDSLVSTADATALRSAGTDYPDWIKRRYISLPDQVPERVLTLARDLTVNARTPYDRAKAIETYLRQFPYTLDLPEPPRRRDMVDYFLFDLQRGYCDYYASAMVVLARGAGLPARLAVGYAAGHYDAANDQYIITEADAHSWPEIYFPDYGWIAFEPTAAQPATDTPQAADVPVAAVNAPEREPTPFIASGGAFLRWGLLIGSGLALIVIMGFLWLAVDRWRLGRLAPTPAIAVLFDRLQNQSQGLAVAAQPGDTPFEFAATLAQTLIGLAPSTRWSPALINAADEVKWLTQLYVRTIYSAHPPQRSDQTQAIAIWQRLHRRLWLARVSRWRVVGWIVG
ncbi:MAG: transglutaminase domain-containing protein [Anaerolineae bacterium]|nr:transglutaminase domain-containing protein [Anaerolineae bacterium]MCB9105623.1 transglutaminase domain-containing protein [Anaerolineales bacterium]